MAQIDPAALARTSAVTVVIPVWNGAGVIADCLRNLYTYSGSALRRVVAVDNASPDESAAVIEREFPQVHLVHSSFNLGFAGGINLGVEAAFAQDELDAVVLLNQDCLVEPQWLDALCAGLSGDGEAAIAGCTLLNSDGTVNHAGARLDLPLAHSRHLTDVTAAPTRMDYVTGAVFAIRRAAWQTLGPLDEDFYPAYYEEADYCYRARRHGWGVLYVPSAKVRHLQTSQQWRKDPLLHWTQQHRARYRFVAKHFSGGELAAFFVAEHAVLAGETWFDQMMGRLLAARHVLRGLDATLQRRCRELEEQPVLADKRQLQVGFADLAQACMQRAISFMQPNGRTFSQRVTYRLGLVQNDRAAAADALHDPSLRAAQTYVLALLAEYEYR